MTTWPDRPTHILVVDDDPRLTEAMTHFLHHSGYTVSVADSGAEALAKVNADPPDLVILDVMMPGMDGWEVCRRLRDSSRIPIIMLTARGGEADRVQGLRLGADDYVPKPFSLKELEARIEAVLRRVNMAPPPLDNIVYDDGHLRLEANGLRVSRDGRLVSLTLTERRLLFRLAERPGQVLTVPRLLTDVWGPDYENQPDYVKLYIWRLRQKVEDNPARPVYILTERGIGYRFAAGDEGTAEGGAPPSVPLS